MREQQKPNQAKKPNQASEADRQLASLEAEINAGQGVPGDSKDDQQKIPTTEALEPLIALLCASVAPAWNVSKPEQDSLAQAYAALIDKYFPEGGFFGPEFNAVLVTAAVIVPRLGKPLTEKKQAEKIADAIDNHIDENKQSDKEKDKPAPAVVAPVDTDGS